ncbi:Site-specific DNA recombinase [Desulfonispora thiosulfatigenes DSM 11270]|uniref:Site-specific DNA recombinase n=1 Tax=Desulfonispora thiosulfatigenes DSM 11270 TaxID=656914 RepID=A0A1W1VR47_DESTI|nr:recombinase family protein [Desulfonispora thiosulfatigenes]SMB95571.1 Site-specific DNA recombinase [Desulfonispora thiosulfatigenes DSM 11270]
MSYKRVAMYLRKSRADFEAEARGEGETLAKHKKTLLKLSKELKLNIVKIYEEVVSGESLIHRPEMLELLKRVENKEYDAVICMDVDRLGRGNMQEQGLILETFKEAHTNIITPRKTYDLHDEWDEEYSEFEAFMARKELKIITRRLQSGRVRSVEEGNYIGTNPPFGYEINRDNIGRTLIPHPEQAPAIKLIFDLYINGGKGSNKIANELNALGYKTYTGIKWKSSSVLTIIKNPIYAGKITWKKKEIKKSKTPGQKRDTKERPKDEWIIADGRHVPIISMETYMKAQAILKSRYHVPYQLENGISNPLAGLIRCEVCGASMVYRPYTNGRDPHIMCYNRFCQNKSSKFKYVEERLIKALEDWLREYKASWEGYDKEESNETDIIEIKRKAIFNLEKELDQLENQKEKLHDFLERGIYDEETYLERSQNLATRIEETLKTITLSKKELKQDARKELAQKNIIPKLENVIKLYKTSKDPAQKNSLLKSVLEKAIYNKEKIQRNDDFYLTLYPKLPK